MDTGRSSSTCSEASAMPLNTLSFLSIFPTTIRWSPSPFRSTSRRHELQHFARASGSFHESSHFDFFTPDLGAAAAMALRPEKAGAAGAVPDEALAFDQLNAQHGPRGGGPPQPASARTRHADKTNNLSIFMFACFTRPFGFTHVFGISSSLHGAHRTGACAVASKTSNFLLGVTYYLVDFASHAPPVPSCRGSKAAA